VWPQEFRPDTGLFSVRGSFLCPPGFSLSADLVPHTGFTGAALVIVEVRGLTKVYEGKQRVVAVDGIDLSVQQGEIFGLLGPNGAGKTTTISIATTRALPTSGQVTIAGVDVVSRPAAARRNIGVVPQYNTLDRSLTVFENLYFHCRYFGYSSAASRTRAQELLSQFLLQERGASFPAQLSGGMQQRVQIARSSIS
jgi:ABC-2 type transport system ATP-binding protein